MSDWVQWCHIWGAGRILDNLSIQQNKGVDNLLLDHGCGDACNMAARRMVHLAANTGKHVIGFGELGECGVLCPCWRVRGRDGDGRCLQIS